MFVNERAYQIMDHLKIHKKATIAELSKALFASESTIRRDLAEMQEQGLIARYHGGAILLEGIGETSIMFRAEKNQDAKDACARLAQKHLPPSSGPNAVNTMFIDNSSTCLVLAKRLDLTNKTVITNGLQIALQLSQKQDIQLIVPGGSVNTNTGAITGSLAARMLDAFGIDIALTSCAALNLDGAFELSLDTAQLKQVAATKSRKKILVATANQFGASATYRVLPLEEYDMIITDADDATVKPLRDKGINVINN